MTGADFLILIAWIVVSVSVGKPVSYLNCYHLPYTKNGDVLTLENWSGMNKSNCFQTKAIWGFSIALA